MLRKMYAFNELLKDYKQSNLADLKKEVERKDKMSDYVIPASLPQPTAYKEPNFNDIVVGSLPECRAYCSSGSISIVERVVHNRIV